MTRTIEAYSLHGFDEPGSTAQGLIDCSALFESIQFAQRRTLRFAIGDDIVAITQQTEVDGKLALYFVTGNPEELPLVYDESTGTVTTDDPGDGRFIVRGVWVFVVPAKRLVFIEKKRPGVPVFQVEKFLGLYARHRLGIGNAVVNLNPVASSSFAEEVKRFTRIREASFTLRRPNPSWSDVGESLLGSAADSNAAEVVIQAKADRGQTLSKDRGLIPEILNMVGNAITALQNAVVRGVMPAYEGERSVSLDKHTVKGSIRLPRMASPDEARTALGHTVDSLAEQIEQAVPTEAGGDDRQT